MKKRLEGVVVWGIRRRWIGGVVLMGIAGGSWSVLMERWIVVSFAGFAVLCCSVESWVRGRNRRVGSDSSSRLKKLESELELDLGAWSFWSRRWRQASGAEGLAAL